MGWFSSILYLYLAGNLYVFIRGWKAAPKWPSGIKLLLGLLYWIAALVFFASFRNRGGYLPDDVAQLLYPVGSAWLLFILYMTLILLATDIFRIFRLRWRHSFITAAGLTACILAYGSWHYHHPVVREIGQKIDKPLDKPQAQLRVVAMSDLHLGKSTGKTLLQKYVELVNAQRPDLILIGGDLVDNDLTPLYKQRMYEEFSQLKASAGIYMVPGNHDYFGGGIQQLQEFLRETPVVLLRDSLVTLPSGLQILGRDDRRAKRKPLPEWKRAILPDKPVIMLDHQPYDLEQTAKAGIDLQFSGHTHRGQVWPLSLISDRMFEMSYGYRQIEASHICVSSGLSLWGPAFRIGTDSEIVVFNLTFR